MRVHSLFDSWQQICFLKRKFMNNSAVIIKPRPRIYFFILNKKYKTWHFSNDFFRRYYDLKKNFISKIDVKWFIYPLLKISDFTIRATFRYDFFWFFWIGKFCQKLDFSCHCVSKLNKIDLFQSYLTFSILFRLLFL